MIAAAVLYEPPENQTLPFIYEVMRDNAPALLERMSYIVDQGHPAIMFEAERFHGIMTHAMPQWQGIASKAALATKRYAPSTPLGDHVSRDGFDAADLKRGNVTVYILVPAGQLPTALPWMNTLMGVFGTAIGRPGAARPVTLLIDEAPSLGYLPDLIPFMAQFRKVGLRVWVFSQLVSHLAAPELYGSEGFKAIAGLASVKQFFAIREKDVTVMVSDMAGERTARNVTKNERGESVGDVGVPLIRPEAVRGLRRWQQIIMVDELEHPIKARLVPYFKRPKWRAMTDENPYRGS